MISDYNIGTFLVLVRWYFRRFYAKCSCFFSITLIRKNWQTGKPSWCWFCMIFPQIFFWEFLFLLHYPHHENFTQTWKSWCFSYIIFSQIFWWIFFSIVVIMKIWEKYILAEYIQWDFYSLLITLIGFQKILGSMAKYLNIVSLVHGFIRKYSLTLWR